jgi:uncharacterized membrane protein
MGFLNLSGFQKDLYTLLGLGFLALAISVVVGIRKKRINDVLGYLICTLLVVAILGVGAIAISPTASKNLVLMFIPGLKG